VSSAARSFHSLRGSSQYCYYRGSQPQIWPNSNNSCVSSRNAGGRRASSLFRALQSNSPFSAPRDDSARARCGNGAKSECLSFGESPAAFGLAPIRPAGAARFARISTAVATRFRVRFPGGRSIAKTPLPVWAMCWRYGGWDLGAMPACSLCRGEPVEVSNQQARSRSGAGASNFLQDGSTRSCSSYLTSHYFPCKQGPRS